MQAADEDRIAGRVVGLADPGGRLAAHRIKLQALLHRRGAGEYIEQVDAAVGVLCPPAPPGELFDLLAHFTGLVLVGGKLQSDILQIGIVRVELQAALGLVEGPCLGDLGGAGLSSGPGPAPATAPGETQKQGRSQKEGETGDSWHSSLGKRDCLRRAAGVHSLSGSNSSVSPARCSASALLAETG